jgi:hypothetical protein
MKFKTRQEYYWKFVSFVPKQTKKQIQYQARKMATLIRQGYHVDSAGPFGDTSGFTVTLKKKK